VGLLPLAGIHLNPLVVLGATGSIGEQTLDVARDLGLEIAVLAARSVSPQLLQLAAAHPDADICIAEPGNRIADARDALAGRVTFGAESVYEAAGRRDHIVMNAIVGAAGLPATLAGLDAGNRVALANKESLVAGGPLVTDVRDRSGGELIPVDSEHSAIWQCLRGEDVTTVARIVLTASGGPFRGMAPTELTAVTVEEALAHPTWVMGPRITIDSATLMNKAFEVIEAHFLFDVGYDSIDVVIHPQSYVHSLVEFRDGVVKAELGPPDMRKPIRYAITAPDRPDGDPPALGLAGRTLQFEAPDLALYPALDLGYEAGRRGGTATAVLNAADEVAVEAFLDGRLSFPGIVRVVEETLNVVEAAPVTAIADVVAADREARAAASRVVARLTV